jgi:hypothetical protein
VAIDSNATCFLHDLDITDTALHYFPSSSFISSLSGLFIVELWRRRSVYLQYTLVRAAFESAISTVRRTTVARAGSTAITPITSGLHAD